MIYQGVTKLPKEVPWTSGSVVGIGPMEGQPPGLWESLKDFNGKAGDSQEDMATHLNHYSTGIPQMSIAFADVFYFVARPTAVISRMSVWLLLSAVYDKDTESSMKDPALGHTGQHSHRD